MIRHIIGPYQHQLITSYILIAVHYQLICKTQVKDKFELLLNSFFLQLLDEDEASKLTCQQQEYESYLVHNIILDLLQRRYGPPVVQDKKYKVALCF